MKKNSFWVAPLLACTFGLAACGSDDTEATSAGPCSIVDLGDGTSAIRCPDGSELVVQNGNDGKDGADGRDGKDVETPCTLTDKGDGTFELVCGEISVILGDACEDGFKADLRVGDSDDEPVAFAKKIGSGGDVSLMLFEMTNCTWVRGDVEVNGYDGEELPSALARIEKVEGDFWIQGNPALQEISLPLLREVGGAVAVIENDSLTTIGDFSHLVAARDLVVYGNGDLVEIGDVPELARLEYVEFFYNQALEKIGSFDELSEIDGSVYWESNPLLVDMGRFPKLAKVGNLHVYGNASLEAVAEFPVLENIDNWLTVEYNDVLTSLAGFSALQTAMQVRIRDNPMLPQCHVDDFLDGITADYVEVKGNDGTATCP